MVISESGARVRAEFDKTSQEVDMLPMNTVVTVAEFHGKRMRISQPCKGWMSRMSAKGHIVARQLELVLYLLFFNFLFLFYFIS